MVNGIFLGLILIMGCMTNLGNESASVTFPESERYFIPFGGSHDIVSSAAQRPKEKIMSEDSLVQVKMDS